MPIYDYRCAACGRRSSHFFLSFSAAASAAPTCPHCGSAQLDRLVSRVALLKSEESRLESLSDESLFAGVDENDPKSVARWARRLGRELGEDAGPEFDELIDRMEAGEPLEEAGAGEPGGTAGDEEE
jgi:putative FmdB family regulatory protein